VARNLSGIANSRLSRLNEICEDKDYVPILVFRKTISRLKLSSRDGESYDDELNRFMDFYEQQNNKIEILYNDGG
jgi:hypothetical protein